MDILYLLIPLSLVFVLIIGAVFWWSLEHGQFDDMEGPAHRILMDDDAPAKSNRVGSADEEGKPPG